MEDDQGALTVKGRCLGGHFIRGSLTAGRKLGHGALLTWGP